MKKVLKVLLISILAICMCLPVVACDNTSASSSTPGLKVKKINGVYTVYDYVQEEGVTVLDIGAKLAEGVSDVRIRKGAFEGNSTLTKIIVPDTVTEIDAGAFQKMSALETLELPFIGKTANSDTYLNETKKADDKSVNTERTLAHVFGSEEYDAGVEIVMSYDVTNTVSAYMPVTFKEVIVNATTEYSIPMFAFNGAVNLSSIVLKGKIDAIGEYAFCGVKEITSIDIPTTVKTIYTGAFMDCTKLATLYIQDPSSLEEVRKNAFNNTKIKDTVFDSILTLTADQKTDIFGE